MDFLYQANDAQVDARCFGSQALDCRTTTAIGICESAPLQLHNSMRIPAGAWIWIMSPCPVRVIVLPEDAKEESCDNLVLIWELASSSGMAFSATAHATWLVPKVPLNESFVKGWSKLSDEIKTQILGHIITFKEAIDPKIAGRPYTPTTMPKCLKRLLCSTPEIAALATEVFYTKNTFFLGRYNESRDVFYFEHATL